MPSSRRTLRRRERPDFESPRCGGVNARLRNRGNPAAARENAIPTVHRRGGFHIRPVYGGAGFRGRDKSRPYGQILCFRQAGGYAAGQAGPIWNRPLHGVFTAVGMFPILNRQGAAGVNARPTEPGKHGGHPGKYNPRGRCKPHVGDDARIVPGCLRRRRVSAGGINPALRANFSFQANRAAAMFAPVCRGGPWPSRGGTRHGRPGRYGIGPYMGCLRRRECSRF